MSVSVGFFLEITLSFSMFSHCYMVSVLYVLRSMLRCADYREKRLTRCS